MCGRFTQTRSKEEVAEVFGLPDIPAYEAAPWSPTEAPARFNIAPTQDVLIVREVGGKKEATWMRWGYVPPTAKDLKGGARMINTRSETVFDKGLFKTALASRRCLVPTDGFFEWLRVDKSKHPFHIQTTGGELFAMAGLYGRWTAPGGQVVETFTILTCPSNDLVEKLHDRMPVVLPKEVWALWLDPSVKDRGKLEPLLVPFDGGLMKMTEVDQAVNSVKNDTEQCIAPVAADDQVSFGF